MKSKLTPRELQVCRELVRGRSNKMIADRLGISESAVRRHLERLFRKFDQDSRTGLAFAVWRINSSIVAETPPIPRALHMER